MNLRQKITDIIWKPRKHLSLDNLKYTCHIIHKNRIVTEHNKNLLVEALRSVAEILIWGDQNDSSVFEYFLERNMEGYILEILTQKDDKDLAIQILQTLNILFENTHKETSIYYLMSNNHITSIITHKYDFSNEEVLAYYISFLKTLSMKLNKTTIHLFFNEVQHLNDFPLYTEAIKFFDNSESMVRIAVRTLTLNVFKVHNPQMLTFICKKTADNFFSNLIYYIGKQALQFDYFLNSEANHTSIAKLCSSSENHLDEIFYLQDILLLDIIDLSNILIHYLLNNLLIPLYVCSLPYNNSIKKITELRESNVTLSTLLSLFLLTQVILNLDHPLVVNSIARAIICENSHSITNITWNFSLLENSPIYLTSPLFSNNLSFKKPSLTVTECVNSFSNRKQFPGFVPPLNRFSPSANRNISNRATIYDDYMPKTSPYIHPSNPNAVYYVSLLGDRDNTKDTGAANYLQGRQRSHNRSLEDATMNSNLNSLISNFNTSSSQDSPLKFLTPLESETTLRMLPFDKLSLIDPVKSSNARQTNPNDDISSQANVETFGEEFHPLNSQPKATSDSDAILSEDLTPIPHFPQLDDTTSENSSNLLPHNTNYSSFDSEPLTTEPLLSDNTDLMNFSSESFCDDVIIYQPESLTNISTQIQFTAISNSNPDDTTTAAIEYTENTNKDTKNANNDSKNSNDSQINENFNIYFPNHDYDLSLSLTTLNNLVDTPEVYSLPQTYLSTLINMLNSIPDDRQVILSAGLVYSIINYAKINEQYLSFLVGVCKGTETGYKYLSIIDNILNAIDNIFNAHNCFRLTTLIVLSQTYALIQNKFNNLQLSDYQFAKLESIKEASIRELRLCYNGPQDAVFMRMLDMEYKQSLTNKNTGLNKLLNDPSILLPPSPTPLSGLELNSRLPSGDSEKALRAIRVFCILRQMYYTTHSIEEDILPLTPTKNSVREKDIISLRDSELIYCLVHTPGGQIVRRFLGLLNDELLIVEPAQDKMCRGVVHQIAFVNNVTLTPSSEDKLLLHLRLHKPNSRTPYYSTELQFQDSIRTMAAVQSLERASRQAIYKQALAISLLLSLPRPNPPDINNVSSKSCRSYSQPVSTETNPLQKNKTFENNNNNNINNNNNNNNNNTQPENEPVVDITNKRQVGYKASNPIPIAGQTRDENFKISSNSPMIGSLSILDDNIEMNIMKNSPH